MKVLRTTKVLWMICRCNDLAKRRTTEKNSPCGWYDVQVFWCRVREKKITGEPSKEECLLNVLLSKICLRGLRVRRRISPRYCSHQNEIESYFDYVE